ncbi:MAG: hypothetical protein ACYSWU_22940, partial [Planctomycetota bacterium]
PGGRGRTLNKLKSPVYLCFFVGGGGVFLGLALVVLGGSLYGPKHWLFCAGVTIEIAGAGLCCFPLFASVVFLFFERLRNRWRRRT